MNKISLLHKVFLILFMLPGFILGCSRYKDPASYLEGVLKNLEKIHSSTYYAMIEAYVPGDTLAYSSVFSFIKEYSNPADTFVGASFLKLKPEDTTILDLCYDGKMIAIVFHENKGVLIDSFKNDPRPFRVVSAPFFTLSKRLINYALETEDSIIIDLKENANSVQCSFFIYDTIVEIVGNRIVYPPSLYGSHKGEVSKYSLWLNKTDDLPYRFERDMPHDKSTIGCIDVKLNTLGFEGFKATDYFPNGYEIREYIRVESTTRKNQLIGQSAPDWTLMDVDNNSVTLANLNSKVLLIQFTSISCGPCRASVQFLNQLASEYDKKEFDFVAIESYNRNPNVLKSYRQRNNMKYKFLLSTKEVVANYQIESVPTFYILDENRIIKRIVRGFRDGTTDKEIREVINSLR